MTKKIFNGLITALVTPFKDATKQIDFDALEKLLDLQINAQVDGILVAGSTGESLSLSYEEYISLISFTIKYVNGRTLVIAGCCASDIDKAVMMVKECERLAVQGIMCVTPFYSRPSQEGLYQYFKTIHNVCNLPIMLYTVPSRTGVNLNDETVIKLAKLDRIAAIKDATGNLEAPLRIRSKLDIDKEFAFLCGVDSLALGFNAQGGSGLVSVTANVAPFESKEIQLLWNHGKTEEAFQLHMKLMPIYTAISIETNPVPVKYAASLRKLCTPEVRLPLCQLMPSSTKLVNEVFSEVVIR
ncbi:4-hydroxy-tetrahydrodipicolinate synthase [Orientia tsutsugamushi]|uniref:4-hydroxy-tetrahydrodipicolinate synthase n=1 Tax=Orientia tsutsugamushi str. TA716 TaxID=1359175 RepID=A0A0F3P8M8_ORITS|nr:4-hydroxy-tetrahydrodipicolinate synthase [Orientia tsutsugamushi]KJV76648.1 dihydrodipicolinate synthase [Orientia tsutsugamushi str. TA716]